MSRRARWRYNSGIGKSARFVILALLAAASIAAALVFRPPLAAAPVALCLLIGYFFGRVPRGAVPRGAVPRPGLAEARRLLDRLPHGIIIHSGGRIVFANERMHNFLCAPPGALEGTLLDSLAQPDDAAVLRSIAENPDLPRELPLRRRDGTTLWAQVEAAPIAMDGETLSQLSVIDVGARRDAEEGRRQLSELSRRQEEQLEHSTRLAELGEMAASISHELNQPLTGIRNYARNAYYMLEQKPGAEADVKNNLRLISEQVDRAAKIINQMRELTRRTDATFSLLDVNSVVRESVEFILPQMKLSEVAVNLRLDESLPPVWGDRIRLEQVFLNLLSNARQAMTDMPVRTLVIETRREPSAALPVVVEVQDTGKGFSETQAGRLFEPFYTTRKGGHGLGLSISRAIVQDHKGTIVATGAPGAGATFTMRLPAAAREGGPARSDG
ncbi:MAG: two-component system sensor histidine kinase NtrB [Spirochaetia bacterium]